MPTRKTTTISLQHLATQHGPHGEYIDIRIPYTGHRGNEIRAAIPYQRADAIARSIAPTARYARTFPMGPDFPNGTLELRQYVTGN